MSKFEACFEVSEPCGSAKVKNTLKKVICSQLSQKKSDRMRKLAWLAGLALVTGFQVAKAQEPVTFKALLDQANSHYPALKSAQLEKRAALEEVRASRRLYWPNLSAVVEGASDQTSATAPNRTLQLEQTLWDAGNIKARVAESKSVADIQTLKAVLLQEEVHLQLANAWQNLVASSERMDVAQRTIERLKIYQQQMQRRVNCASRDLFDQHHVDQANRCCR
jgi:outer membrane protein TolC